MYSLNISEDGRILSATLEKYNPNGVIVNSLPEGDISDYIYTREGIIYSPKEIIKTNEEKIGELKQLLTDTDYQAIKYAEGLISEEQYLPIKTQRQAWRSEINLLEAIV